MKVTVNGQPRELLDGARLGDVVAGLSGGRRTGIAVAVNGEVVPKSDWDEALVDENDVIEVLSAIGGG